MQATTKIPDGDGVFAYRCDDGTMMPVILSGCRGSRYATFATGFAGVDVFIKEYPGSFGKRICGLDCIADDGSVGRVEERLVLLPEDEATSKAIGEIWYEAFRSTSHEEGNRIWIDGINAILRECAGVNHIADATKMVAELQSTDEDRAYIATLEAKATDAIDALVVALPDFDRETTTIAEGVKRLQGEVERLGRELAQERRERADSVGVERTRGDDWRKRAEEFEAERDNLRTQLAARPPGDGPRVGREVDGKRRWVVVLRVDNYDHAVTWTGSQWERFPEDARDFDWLDTPAPPPAEAKGIDLGEYAKRWESAFRDHVSDIDVHRSRMRIIADIARAVAREEMKGGQS